MSDPATEPQSQSEVIQLSKLFNPSFDPTSTPFSTSEFVAMGVQVSPIDPQVIDRIFDEAIVDAVRAGTTAKDGELRVSLDKRTFFSIVCGLIDEEYPFSTNREFLYAVSVVLDLLKRADSIRGGGIGGLVNHQPHITEMLGELLLKGKSPFSNFHKFQNIHP